MLTTVTADLAVCFDVRSQGDMGPLPLSFSPVVKCGLDGVPGDAPGQACTVRGAAVAAASLDFSGTRYDVGDEGPRQESQTPTWEGGLRPASNRHSASPRSSVWGLVEKSDGLSAVSC